MEVREEEAYGFVPVRLGGEVPLYLVTLHHKGHWAFPKGHAEEGELPLESALRELKEETGLTPKRIHAEQEFTEEYTYRHPGGYDVHKINTFWVAEVGDDPVVPQAEEVLDFAWLPYDQAMERMTFTVSQELLLNADVFVRML